MRIPVELRRAYRLINHGPTTLISAAANGRINVMAAAWVMALDFDPPKVAAVIDSKTFTRSLIDASGEFCVSLPTRAMVDLTWRVGSTSGRDLDKLRAFGIATSPASHVDAPLIDGCVGWLECRVLDEPAVKDRYDLLLAEVVAAWADDRAFDGAEWQFRTDDDRTIHHLAKGVFFTTGERVAAKQSKA